MDAYKSELSCVVVDDIESLLDYAPIGPRFSNLIFQTLKILFKSIPPRGRKLIIVATSGEKDLLKELGLIKTFSQIIYVPNVSRGVEILNVVEQLESFNKSEIDKLSREIKNRTCSIGIKTLIDLIEYSKQSTDEYRMVKFVRALEDYAGMHSDD
jgi:vesicle-fusing ATPase